MALYPLLRPLLFALDPERAHRLTIAGLKMRGVPPSQAPKSSLLATRIAGIDFSNPIGLAPGFDKDAEVFAQSLSLGFGFVEVGTLTPRPQPGNPKPRLFRLTEDRAIINRMGFNNQGQAAALTRLRDRFRKLGVVGVNIGANKENAGGDAAIADYVFGVRTMAEVADYLTINISSPNTPGLRDLQDEGALNALLSAVNEARGAKPPIFLKVAPDLEPTEIDAIAKAAIDHKIDGLIVGNTTVSRPDDLQSEFRIEAGGLSGAPLRDLAMQRLRDFRKATGGALPLISVGGIESGPDVYDRIRAGASLVQLYTALVYQGPGLVQAMLWEVQDCLEAEGFSSITEAVGTAP